MRSVFVEQLEDRQFLSAGVAAVEPGLVTVEPAVSAARLVESARRVTVKRMPRVGDVFKGTSKWREYGEVVSVHITMRVTKLIRTGEYKVAGSSTDDRTARYTYSVHIKKDGTFTFEFTGHNVNGTDTGSGSGKISADGKTLTGSNSSSLNPSRPSFSVKLQ
jgi:hypothetical protein